MTFSCCFNRDKSRLSIFTQSQNIFSMNKKSLLSLVIAIFTVCSFHSQSLNSIDYELLNDYGGDINALSSFGFSDNELPTSYSLENYAFVSSQNGGSCVGFAVTGAMNIMHNFLNDFTSFDFKYPHTFDPYYLYCAIKDPDDISCIGENCNCGSYIKDALDVVTAYGVKKTALNPLLDCGNQINKSNLRTMSEMTSLYSIDEYYNLFAYEKIKGEWYVTYNIHDFKNALSQNYPIVTGIDVDNSFGELGSSNPKYSASENSIEGHAVTIVGYDDDKYGGSFRIMNSYGSDWGDDGFFWMTYEDYFNSSERAYILFNDSWDSWFVDEVYVSDNFYRGFSKDESSFWEGPINSDGYFHGKGIEITNRHSAVGAYNNGFRNGWWLILEQPNLEDPWRGLVLFEDGEVMESESFGFSSDDSEKNGFVDGLHLENYIIDINESPATEEDLDPESVQNKVTKE